MAGNKWHPQSVVKLSANVENSTSGNRETGIIEKLLSTYGFIRCCDRQARIFFHYSQFDGNVEHLKAGDPVEFELGFDKKSGKPIAMFVQKICSEFSANLGEQSVNGIVTTELSAEGKGGCVAYEKYGECFFLEFSKKDLSNPDEKLVNGESVEFLVAQDAGGNLFVKNVHSAPPASADSPPSFGSQKKINQRNANKQSFGMTPLVYSGLPLPTLASNGQLSTAYIMQQANQIHPMVQQPAHLAMNGLTSQFQQAMSGSILGTDAETATIQSEAQQTVTKSSFKSNPTSTNSSDLLQRLQLLHQQRQQYQQQTGNNQQQHLSGQSTTQQQLQQMKHQAAGQSQNYPGTTLSPTTASTKTTTTTFSSSTSNNTTTTRKDPKTITKNNNPQSQSDSAENYQTSQSQRYQGVVCTIKEAYGFVERADVVKEIFFHCTEGYDGISPGDDVSFDIMMRNGREIAVNLKQLPPGTVIFDDIDSTYRKGSVTQLPNSMGEPLDGRLTYEENGESKELGFADRDLAPCLWTMKIDDPVEFQLATDRRDGLVRATNIFFSVGAPNAFAKESRFSGTVTALKDSFGFITISTPDQTEYYFKLSEVLDPELRIDSYVQFSLEAENSQGSNNNNLGGGGSSRQQAAIRICKSSSSPKKKIARKSARCTLRGYIVALKEHFGFIESENREEDLFFRFNSFDGDVDTLKLGDEVEYSLQPKSQKPSADCVRAIGNGSIPGIELISDERYTGKVLRPLRCFNPEQELYCGLLKMKPSADKSVKNENVPEEVENGAEDDKCKNNNLSTEAEYVFSVMSLAKSGTVMQKHDIVEFQLARSKVTQKTIAVNVSLIRERKTATIESVKGQVYYLNFEVENGKKLSFLANETKLNGTLSVGTVVEFDFVRGRNNKWTATNVRRVKTKEPTPRPQSLIDRYKSQSIVDDGPRVVAIRQPRGPDDSKGFLILQAVSA